MLVIVINDDVVGVAMVRQGWVVVDVMKLGLNNLHNLHNLANLALAQMPGYK